MAKGTIESPFKSQLIPEVKSKTQAGDVVDRNQCPVFGKPRESGSAAQPEVFSTGVNGKNYHGSISGKAAVSSTMGSSRKEK